MRLIATILRGIQMLGAFATVFVGLIAFAAMSDDETLGVVGQLMVAVSVAAFFGCVVIVIPGLIAGYLERMAGEDEADQDDQ